MASAADGSRARWFAAAVAVTAAGLALGVLLALRPATPAPPSALPPTAPPPSAPAAGRTGPVPLRVGDDLQAVVEAHPPGTTFRIERGVHREQRIQARDGDVYLGEPGAVLSGARVLTSFAPAGGDWVTTVEGLAPSDHGEMLPGRAQDANPQDLFLDGVRRSRAASRADVGPGTWFLDYDTDRLYMGDRPSGRLVELSVTDAAFVGEGTRGVTIADLEVRQYATIAQRGAVQGFGTHEWTLRDVVSRDNHGVGIRVGSGMHVSGCRVTGNGHSGFAGGQQEPQDRPISVTGCEIAGNGVLGYAWYWEGGGTKFVLTDGMRFARNLVYDNIGPGVWFDIDNTGARIVDNVVRDNSIMGIFYEISYEGLIQGNEVRGNGWAAPREVAAGIAVANSADTVVRDNVLSGNTHEIYVSQADRGEGSRGPYATTGLLVEGNDVRVTDGWVGFFVEPGQEAVLTDGDNRFRDNDYVLQGCDPCFFWGDGRSPAQWAALHGGESLPVLTSDARRTVR